MMLLEDWMVQPLHTVGGGTPLEQCAKIMRERGFRHLPVLGDDGELAGLLTDFEFELRGMFLSGMWMPHDDSDRWLLAREVARVPEVTASPSTPLAEALASLADAYLDSIIAVEDGRPVGILTEHDIVGHALDMLPADATSEVISQTEDLPMLPDTTSPAEVRSIMARKRLRHVMILHRGALSGVLSYRDVALEDQIERLSLSDVMHEPMSHKGPLSARKAASFLFDKKIGCLPIVDDEGLPTAMVTRRQILSVVRDQLAG